MDNFNISELPWFKIEFLRAYCEFPEHKEELFMEDERKLVTSVLSQSALLYDDKFVSENFSLLQKTCAIVNRVHVATVRQYIMRNKRKYGIAQLDDVFKKQIFMTIKEDYLNDFYCDEKLFDVAFELIWEYMSICYSVWEYMTFLTLTEVHVENAKQMQSSENENPYKTNYLFNNEALERLIEGYFISLEDIITIDEAINNASKELGFSRKSLKKLIFLEETAGNSLHAKYHLKLDELISNALNNLA